MKIKKSQLRSLIRNELSRALSEARHAGGVQQGATVWLKDDPSKGKGTVRGKYKDPRIGHIILVQWETGDSSRHIPSALTASQEIAQTDSASGRGKKLDPNLLKGAYVSSQEDRAAMKDYIAKLKMKKMTDSDGEGYDEYPKHLGYTHPETEIDLDLSKIKNIVIEGIDMADHPDFSDAFVASAEYEYAPREFRDLTQEEIDYLNENEDEWVWNQVWEQVN